MLAPIISYLRVHRTFDLTKTSPDSRDEDGNIISTDPMELRHYYYNTGLIPSDRFEELLRLMTKDHHQALMLYHQLVQGMLYDRVKHKVRC